MADEEQVAFFSYSYWNPDEIGRYLGLSITQVTQMAQPAHVPGFEWAFAGIS